MSSSRGVGAAVESDPRLATYVALRDRAATLFDGLRDLPEYGDRVWSAYFRRTFDAHNAVWHHMNEHRQRLAVHGLQRHQVGECASRIAQLYYLYYLRRGDTSYLEESFAFFDLIWCKKYFAPPQPDGRQPPLLPEGHAARELRYYARFAVVCLLCGKRTVLHDILLAFEQRLEEQAALDSPRSSSERGEWVRVVGEFQAFVSQDPPIAAPRLQPQNTLPLVDLLAASVDVQSDHHHLPWLRLSEAILVGASASQLKVSELTVDSFRMLHAIEWDAASYASHYSSASTGAEDQAQSTPRKYLLRPTVGKLMLALSTSLVEKPPRSALLLYISADGIHTSSRPSNDPPNQASSSATYDPGGIALAVAEESAEAVRGCCFRPHDLVPYCRMPLVVVVESDNAHAFASLPDLARCYQQPLLCLLAPCPVLPTARHAHEATRLGGGGALTLFLYDPIAALCALFEVESLAPNARSDAQSALEEMSQTLARSLGQSFLTPYDDIDCNVPTPAFGVYQPALAFLHDPFVLALMVRFLICKVAYARCKHTRALIEEGHLRPPLCAPAVGGTAACSEALDTGLQALLTAMGVEDGA